MADKGMFCVPVPFGKRAGLALLPNFLLILIFTLYGYFMYDGTDGALAVLLMVSVMAIASLVAFVPYFGVVIYGLASYFWLMPHVIDTTTLPDGFTDDWIYWGILLVYLILGVIYTYLGTIAWRERKK